MASSRTLKIAAVLSYGGIAVNLFVSLIYSPIMIRSLGKTEYGLLSLCQSFTSYLSMFTASFSQTYIRYFLRSKALESEQRVSELNGMFFLIFSAIAALAMIGGIAIYFNSEFVFGAEIKDAEYALLRKLWILIICTLVFTNLNVVFTSIINASERFIFLKVTQITFMLAKPIIMIPILLMGYKSVAVMVFAVILDSFSLGLNAWFCLSKIHVKFSFARFDFSLLKEMLVFSGFVLLRNIMDIFNWQVDKFIISRFWGVERTAIYSVGSTINSMFQQISASLLYLFIPTVNRLVALGNSKLELDAMFVKLGRSMFCIAALCFTGFLFFGKPFVQIYAGSGYENSYYVALLLTAPLVGLMTMLMANVVIQARFKHKLQTVIGVLAALLNLLISIPLCKLYGEVGAAVGTCIGMIVCDNIILYFYAQKYGELNTFKLLKNVLRILPALLLPVVFGIFLSLCVDMRSLTSLAACIFVYSCVYFGSMWFLAMNGEERNMFARPTKKVWGKLIKHEKPL